MPPDEKKAVKVVAEQHGNQFTVVCIKQINMECCIPMKEMQNICWCLEYGWEHPSQLDMEHPVLTNQSVVADEVHEANMQVTDASNGIKWFQLKPPGLKGQTFLDHMFAQCQISFKTQDKELYAPNDYLDLAMKPCNVTILKHMTAPYISKRSAMQDYAGNGATLNLNARKLNQTGYIQRRCGLVNMEDKVRKLKNALQLSQSMATISNEQINDADQKKIELQAMHRVLAPSALTKLMVKNEHPTKITKKDILSTLFSVFLILEEEKNRKKILVEILMKQTDKDPTKIPFKVCAPSCDIASNCSIGGRRSSCSTRFSRCSMGRGRSALLRGHHLGPHTHSGAV
jgi:hypothetical protein